MNNLKIKKNELITALLFTKKIIVCENHVTTEEYEHYIQMIKKELNTKYDNIEINDQLNKEDFYKDGVWFKSNIPMNELIKKYGRNPLLLFLYDIKFQQKVIKDYYQSKINKINIALSAKERKIKALVLSAK